MGVLDLRAIEDELIDDTWKGIPGGTPPFPLRQIGTHGWNVPAGDLPLPVLTIRRSAVEHNVAVMARFCAQTSALLAPHGKTTMAPQLFDRQLAAGAWGITAATVQQLQVYRRFGVARVILANQLIGDSVGAPRVSVNHDIRIDLPQRPFDRVAIRPPA